MRPAAGYKLLPHTADVAFEAWAPTRGECVAQAVRALVGCFADARGPAEGGAGMAVERASDEDLLVSVLDEVIYLLETRGEVPVEASVGEPAAGAAEVRFATVPLGRVRVVGAVPKAVSLHGLRFGQVGGAWRCHVVVDV